MSEICPECLDKIMKTDDTAKKYIISKDLDLCEECGEYKPVVIRMKKRYLWAQRFLDIKEALSERRNR